MMYWGGGEMPKFLYKGPGPEGTTLIGLSVPNYILEEVCVCLSS